MDDDRELAVVDRKFSMNSTAQVDTDLCGFPPFCSILAIVDCNSVVLSACKSCSMFGASVFAACVALLGIAIVSGNALVLIVSRTMQGRSKLNAIKGSLAVADMLTGIQILVITMYNFHWTINSTSEQINRVNLSSRNSPHAIAGGIFFFVTYVASLCHLFFLSLERLYAINWPIKYKMQKTRTIHICLAITWCIAVLIAALPSWFRGSFHFTYYHVVFLFYPAVDISDGHSYLPETFFMVFLLTPYVLTVLVIVVTTVLVQRTLRENRILKQSTSVAFKQAASRKERKILFTVSIMVAGFTVTTVPLVVILSLLYVNYLDCSTISRPYLIGFYTSMANSVVNVLVYSFRDEDFKKAVLRMTAGWKQKVISSMKFGSHTE